MHASSHSLFNLFILMGFPIHVDTISMGLSILYFKVLAYVQTLVECVTSMRTNSLSAKFQTGNLQVELK